MQREQKFINNKIYNFEGTILGTEPTYMDSLSSLWLWKLVTYSSCFQSSLKPSYSSSNVLSPKFLERSPHVHLWPSELFAVVVPVRWQFCGNLHVEIGIHCRGRDDCCVERRSYRSRIHSGYEKEDLSLHLERANMRSQHIACRRALRDICRSLHAWSYSFLSAQSDASP